MEMLSIAKARLKTAHNDHERDYEAQITKLDSQEDILKERLRELDKKKIETAQANGAVDAAGDDLIEVNAGGNIIAAKRSTLTQMKGTRMEALFSGRWDQKLQRDIEGRIFLDVNHVGFRAIVDYLNEVTISSDDNPPAPPSVQGEHEHILKHQLELFGLLSKVPMVEIPDSNIIKDEGHVTLLHDWLKEDGTDGKFELLYRSTRDGPSGANFHSKCDSQGCTIAIIETTDGFVLGGYSNTPWESNPRPAFEKTAKANKAFLFVLSGSDTSSPCKMRLKNPNDGKAVSHNSSFGPMFGAGNDFATYNSQVKLRLGNSYESCPQGQLTTNTNGDTMRFAIKEMEVFQVSGMPSPTTIVASKEKQIHPQIQNFKPVTMFSESINKAINTRHEYLLRAESEMCHLEDGFKDEHEFIATFASGDTKDVVLLNVSGMTMATKRSTLQAAEGSVLSQQFDDSKWKEQGCKAPRVKDWTPDNVSDWVRDIEGIPGDMPNVFKDAEITGHELLALGAEGLKSIGVKRSGTAYLLVNKIQKLEKASQDIVTFIEHSPYCFGKILDYLRMKQFHLHGLAEEPALPTTCDSLRGRFEKVVRYYFPGDSAKFILG